VIGYNRGYNTVDYGPPKQFGIPHDAARLVNNSPNNTGIQALPPARAPLVAYPYGVSEEWPQLGSGGRCAVGGPIFYASNFAGPRRFPDYYEGKWFVVDFVRTWIMVATMNADRTKVVALEPFLPDEKYTLPLDMDFGPNGDMYIIEYSPTPGGRLSKIEYNAGNRAPKVAAAADRVAGATPLRVTLSSRGTVDPDGDKLSYRWTLIPEKGAAQEFSDANPVVTLNTPGAYRATLVVSDPSGASSRDSVKVVAGNEAPRVDLAITKGNRSFYFPGERIDYAVRATDQEDGQPAPDRVIVTADYVPSGMTPRELASASAVSPDESMRHLRAVSIIARSDCVACHRMDSAFVGPGFRQVAQRYAGQAAVEKVAQKIITGGKGVWGEVAMPPHPSITPAEASTLAQYVLSQSNTSTRPRRLPLSGSYATAERRAPAGDRGQTRTERGSYVLRASYTDNGANGVAPLTTSTAVLLRHPVLAPETADSISRGITFNASKGDPGFVIRRSASHVAFKDLDLTGIGSVEIGALTRFYTWSHFKGATIEVHLDSANGPLAGAPVTIVPPAAKADPVVLGDNLEKPVTVRLRVPGGIHDVYFVFRNTSAKPAEDLLLLTGIEFKPGANVDPEIPAGFTRIFNGRDLTGWHVSRTTHQGTTPDVRVEDGAIVLRQRPYGQGGLLMTDRKYKNFELFLEAKPDWGTNGGIFFRSSEGGSGYQIEVEGGGTGGTGSLFGEMMRVSKPVQAKGVQAVWRADDWNAFRIRVTGDVPRVRLWINDVEFYNAQLGRNDLIGGRTDGMIALQSHWSSTFEPVEGSFDMSSSWKPGASHRYRNVAIRELP
jgi:cytochrome c